MGWEKGWLTSAETTLRFVGEDIYGTEYDPTLKSGIKNRKEPAEILEYQQMNEIVSEIKGLVQKEKLHLEAENQTGASSAFGQSSVTASDQSSVTASGLGAPDSDPEEARWKTYADRLSKTYLTFMPEAATEGQMATLLSLHDQRIRCRHTELCRLFIQQWIVI